MDDCTCNCNINNVAKRGRPPKKKEDKCIITKYVIVTKRIDEMIKELADEYRVSQSYIMRESMLRGMKILWDITIQKNDNVKYRLKPNKE